MVRSNDSRRFIISESVEFADVSLRSRKTMPAWSAFAFVLCGRVGHRRAGRPRILLKNICRVKGQEENTLHGLGLVVGLKGSGDGGDFLPTIRGLSTALQLMGNNPFDKQNNIGIKDAKNVALVMVTATIPAAGARQGDTLDCVVSSIGSAKSLAGGTLFMTPLQGPQVPQQGRSKGNQSATPRGSDSRVFGFAQGPLHVDGLPPTVGPDSQGLPAGRGLLQRVFQGRQDHAGARQGSRRFSGGPGHRRVGQQPVEFSKPRGLSGPGASTPSTSRSRFPSNIATTRCCSSRRCSACPRSNLTPKRAW